MKKIELLSSVLLGFALTVGSNAQAVTFQVDDKTSLSLSGRVYLKYSDTKNSDGVRESNYGDSNRIRFRGKTQLSDSTTGFFGYELRPKDGFNNLGGDTKNDDTELETRTARIGIENNIGEFAVGRQARLYDTYIDNQMDIHDELYVIGTNATANRRSATFVSNDINGFRVGAEVRLNSDSEKVDNNGHKNSLSGLISYDNTFGTLSIVYDQAKTQKGNVNDNPIIGAAFETYIFGVNTHLVYQKDESQPEDLTLAGINLIKKTSFGRVALTTQNVDKSSESRTEVILNTRYYLADNVYTFAEYAAYGKEHNNDDGYALGIRYNF